MKRNFSKEITNLSGVAMTEGASLESVLAAVRSVWPALSTEVRDQFDKALKDVGAKPLTLAAACCTALLGAHEDERSLAGDVRSKRYRLAGKIHGGGVVEITADERDMIKPLLFKTYAGSLVPVVAADLLEGEGVKEDAPAAVPQA